MKQQTPTNMATTTGHAMESREELNVLKAGQGMMGTGERQCMGRKWRPIVPRRTIHDTVSERRLTIIVGATLLMSWLLLALMASRG